MKALPPEGEKGKFGSSARGGEDPGGGKGLPEGERRNVDPLPRRREREVRTLTPKGGGGMKAEGNGGTDL
ncbi:MAG: hypothetical protein DSO02_06830 [Hadesarchaea archaeon]|nr:MAG: hypothetical protein DSO02_06830 [Hadesarchaea archaeon]